MPPSDPLKLFTCKRNTKSSPRRPRDARESSELRVPLDHVLALRSLRHAVIVYASIFQTNDCRLRLAFFLRHTKGDGYVRQGMRLADVVSPRLLRSAAQ